MAINPLSDTDIHSKITVGESGSEDLRTFLTELFEHPRPRYASFSFTLDAIDPLAYLEMCWQKDIFQYYWEKPSEDFAIAAGGEILNLSATGPDRFHRISSHIQTIKESTAEFTAVPHAYSGMMLLGGFSFSSKITQSMWTPFQPASFRVPEWVIIKDGKFNLLTLSMELSSFENAEKLHRELINTFEEITETCNINYNTGKRSSNFDTDLLDNGTFQTDNDEEYRHWINAIQQSKNLIEQQKFQKIVLAREVSVVNDKPIVPTEVLNRLRNQYTNCYNFLVHQPQNATFLGSSPERLASFRKRTLLTEALAGSIQRGNTATEDTVLENNLSGSNKNQNEHNFVVRDIIERLAPFSQSLDRRSEPEIKKLTNVQHLYTPIRAQLTPDANILEVIGELHPTPAVGGYPWSKAAPYIKELENFDRGWYASPVGWLNSKGTGEFAVGIRSGLLSEERAHFFAGCGIVADSDPDDEWEETNLKLKPMLSAIQYD